MHYSIEVHCDTDPNTRRELDTVAYCPTDGVLEGGGGYYWHFKTHDAWQRVQARLRKHLDERVLMTTRDTSGRMRVHRSHARKASKPAPATYRLEVVASPELVAQVRVLEAEIEIAHGDCTAESLVWYLPNYDLACAFRDDFLRAPREQCSVVLLTHADEPGRTIGGARAPLCISR